MKSGRGERKKRRKIFTPVKTPLKTTYLVPRCTVCAVLNKGCLSRLIVLYLRMVYPTLNNTVHSTVVGGMIDGSGTFVLYTPLSV